MPAPASRPGGRVCPPGGPWCPGPGRAVAVTDQAARCVQARPGGAVTVVSRFEGDLRVGGRIARPDPTAMLAALVAAWALDRNTSAPAWTSVVAWVSRRCGSAAVPHRHTTTERTRPSASAVSIAAATAGASRRAGSGSAPCPRTTSNRTTETSGSSAWSVSRASRTVGSIIGCGRPRVNASSPRSRITCPWPASRGTPWRIASAGSPSSGRSGMLDRISPSVPAATTMASSAKGALKHVEPRERARPATAGGSGSHVGQAGSDTPSTPSRSRVAAVMSGRPGPSSTVLVGVWAAAAAASTRSAVAWWGGLEMSTM